MFSILLRVIIPLLTILAVSQVSHRSPRLGALLLTLPLVSILAFGAVWSRDHDLKSLSQMARETLILVPLAYSERLGLGCITRGWSIHEFSGWVEVPDHRRISVRHSFRERTQCSHR